MANNLAPVGADMVSFEPSRSREDIANIYADAEIANGSPLSDVKSACCAFRDKRVRNFLVARIARDNLFRVSVLLYLCGLLRSDD